MIFEKSALPRQNSSDDAINMNSPTNTVASKKSRAPLSVMSVVLQDHRLVVTVRGGHRGRHRVLVRLQKNMHEKKSTHISKIFWKISHRNVQVLKT